MEDASKAIIIAGAVLIGIIITSAVVALWMNFSANSQENAKKMLNDQINQYNVKFEKYDFEKAGNKYITAQDVKTLVGLAKDYNDRFKDNGVNITVNVESRITSSISRADANALKWTTDNWKEFLEESLEEAVSRNNLSIYKAVINTGLDNKINNIIITKK